MVRIIWFGYVTLEKLMWNYNSEFWKWGLVEGDLIMDGSGWRCKKKGGCRVGRSRLAVSWCEAGGY